LLHLKYAAQAGSGTSAGSGAEELARAPMPDGRRLMHGLMKVSEVSPAELEAAQKVAFAGKPNP
jgi:hypothetical protein